MQVGSFQVPVSVMIRAAAIAVDFCLVLLQQFCFLSHVPLVRTVSMGSFQVGFHGDPDGGPKVFSSLLVYTILYYPILSYPIM